MTSRMKTGLRCAIVCTSLCAMTGAAEAARWQTCNGSPVKWRDTLNIHRNRCSIPDTGDVNSAYWNGMRQWDRLSTVVDSTRVNAASDCEIAFDDGQNEVALLDRSEIDGNNGLTILQLGFCFINNSIDEADIMVANDMDFTAQRGDFVGKTGRSTFVHEFGHFFGFEHDDSHSVMRTTAPRPLTGGVEPSTLWPNDSIGMKSLYGFSTTRPNLLPSALSVVGGSVQALDPVTTVTMCGGGTRATRVYLGNSGNAASGTYNLRVRLSRTAPMTGYFESTEVAGSFTHSLGAFSQVVVDLPFKVPFSLPNGTYFIYTDMDFTGTIAEILEGDNSTVSAMKVRVNC
jgi:hypothetical protein